MCPKSYNIKNSSFSSKLTWGDSVNPPRISFPLSTTKLCTLAQPFPFFYCSPFFCFVSRAVKKRGRGEGKTGKVEIAHSAAFPFWWCFFKKRHTKICVRKIQVKRDNTFFVFVIFFYFHTFWAESPPEDICLRSSSFIFFSFFLSPLFLLSCA